MKVCIEITATAIRLEASRVLEEIIHSLCIVPSMSCLAEMSAVPTLIYLPRYAASLQVNVHIVQLNVNFSSLIRLYFVSDKSERGDPFTEHLGLWMGSSK